MNQKRANNKHFRKVVPRENKWWYRYIRGMSWFSFRYWWFNWLVFLACIFLFWWFCPCTQETPVKKCSTNINEHINDINAIIDSCCDCNAIIEEPEILEPPEPPEGSTPCNSQVVPGGLTPGETQTNEIYLGEQPGRVTITFDMFSCADKLEVFYNGTMIKNTGFVRHEGNFSFYYNPVPNVYTCTIKMTGGNDNCSVTNWKYMIGCPQ
jgi:hypothetical protein